ncbi:MULTISPECIES: polysaccharide pyruvyl transferase family protein [Marinobacter]|uniref:polysaccharide pyruvyl transferase family protein n=1 Tax=Marinobacter TaxID=2742 RepID=UPI001247097F|nr:MULTISPECIES: polysaccharide pyruvyl transferase family protein [Marinobacter]MBL3556713.1 polysaccharide pyruvyl transferase family protein [Marinobacter sp. JB05H06]
MNEHDRPKRILVTNIVSLNTGDAAILWGMFEIFRRRYGSNTRVIVFDKSAEAAGRYYPWANFRQAMFGNPPRTRLGRKMQANGFGHWVERLRFMKLSFVARLCRWKVGYLGRLIASREDCESVAEYVNADLVVSTGGTYLTENYGLWTNIRDYRLTLIAGAPLAFFTQTLGPFAQPRYRQAFTDIFHKATAICLRDERSRQHVLELGIPADKIALAKDAAFVIDVERPAPPSGALRIAVSVRTMHFFNDGDRSLGEQYKASVTAMVNRVVRDYGAEVVFLSTCQGIPEYWTDDTKLADEIVSALPQDVAPNVTVDRQFRQPLDIVRAYQSFHMVIATRMHAAILSLVAGTPVLGIAYEFKLEELFHQLGMDEARLSTKEMNPEGSEAALGHMLDNLEFWREKVFAVRADCNRQAAAVMDQLPDV